MTVPLLKRISYLLDSNILKSVWETNLKVRPERDWERLERRSIVKKS